MSVVSPPAQEVKATAVVVNPSMVRLCDAVEDTYKEIGSQLSLCNNLLAQLNSLWSISAPMANGEGAIRSSLASRMRSTRQHPSWNERLNARLHMSLSACVDRLRQLGENHLPKLTRQFDQALSADDSSGDLLFKQFGQCMAVDARDNLALFRYQFEADDRILLSTHLRRLSARIKSELERLASSVNHSKKRRSTAVDPLSLEPDFLLDGTKAQPNWATQLAIVRLRKGGEPFLAN